MRVDPRAACQEILLEKVLTGRRHRSPRRAATLSGDPNIRRTKSEKTALCQSLTKSLVQWEQIMYIHPR